MDPRRVVMGLTSTVALVALVHALGAGVALQIVAGVVWLSLSVIAALNARRRAGEPESEVRTPTPADPSGNGVRIREPTGRPVDRRSKPPRARDEALRGDYTRASGRSSHTTIPSNRHRTDSRGGAQWNLTVRRFARETAVGAFQDVR